MTAIKHQLVQRTQPRALGANKKKNYPSIAHREHTSLKELSEVIADGRTLTPSDVMAVLISLSRKMPQHLHRGNIVDLGEMGTLTVNISSKGAINELDFIPAFINGLNIRYRLTTDMKILMKTTTSIKWNDNKTLV